MKIASNTHFIVLIFLIYGCSGQTTLSAKDHKAEAEAFCAVFNPKKWESLSESLEPFERQQLLAKEISSAATSTEMQNILHSLKEIGKEQRYTYYIEEVSKLTGEKQECKNFKSYLQY